MKVFLKTYGCRANQYDTESVRAMLAAGEVEETDDVSQADYAVFNSCTVTAAAEADLRSDVRSAFRANPALKTVVMGCAAGVSSRDERTLPLYTLPGVSAVIAGGDVAEVGLALGVSTVGVAVATGRQSGAHALLRIQDGCDEHCTFCATTSARGANRSRSIESISHEAIALAETHPEIVLTGIHIGTYGVDIDTSLGKLVSELVDKVPCARFRLSSVEATEVDDRLAELLTGIPERVAPHLHAPLQSGSDAVLRRMGRHWYTAAAYESAVSRLTSNGAPFALSADVITGFPGETDADHQATVSMVERMPFTSLHVFPYSPRPGTAALKLKGQVGSTKARERASDLRAIADRKASAYKRQSSGQVADVVVIERGIGLTGDYLSVMVADPLIPRRTRFTGRLEMRAGRLTAHPLKKPDA